MRNRSAYLLLALLVLAIFPAWAPAGLSSSARSVIERDTMFGSTQTATKSTPKFSVTPAADALPEYALYLPSNATAGQPLQVMVALHGMGGNGPDFAQHVLPIAEGNGWAVLAPTLQYRDYRDPEAVRLDGGIHPRLKALIDALPSRTGLTMRPQALLYGFSRGSQEAHRFSFMYPEATLAVAGMSAGSYTLPSQTYRLNAQDSVLAYPYGTAEVEKICGRSFNAEAAQKVRYWIAVGGSDNRVEDVPRQFDTYIGTNRVERAQRFVTALQQFGAQAQVKVFPGAAHEITDLMRDEALRFLATAAA